LLAQITHTFEEFVYAGPLSPGALVGVGILMALVMVALIVRERRGRSLWLTAILWTCRIVAAIVVLWMLAEPVWRTTLEHEQQKAVTVLVDTSQSMSVVDVGDEDPHAAEWSTVADIEADALQRANRMEKVAATLKNAERSWLRTVEEQAKVIRCRFDQTVYPAGSNWEAIHKATDSESADRTDLSAALARIFEAATAEHLQAAFLITDGGHNAGEYPLDSITAADIPV
jgi:hypothetical protein